jgi:hypothetical protein
MVDCLYLDDLVPERIELGYGELGRTGSLGYEGKSVSVRQQPYPHALSAHAPARLVYQLDGRARQFQSHVALNDDVRAGVSHADFDVYADGRQVACEPYVVAGDAPRLVCADISGAQTLELVVETTRWECCHAVWLDPAVSEEPVALPTQPLVDPLGRVEITLPPPMPRAQRCIATVVSPGFEPWADNLLGSLRANGGCADARLALLAVETNGECERIARKYDALLVACRRRAPLDVTVKAVLYSIARVIPAEHYLCLDADMLVLGSLAPIFDALDAAPGGSALVCREANYSGTYTLGAALVHTYFGGPADLPRVLGRVNGEADYPLVVNDGIFAGKAAALRAIDGAIRRMPQAIGWMQERRQVCWWRNQFVFNLALAQLRCGVELDGGYNVQLHTSEVDVTGANGSTQALWRGRPVRVLHFCGIGKQKYPHLHRLYAG